MYHFLMRMKQPSGAFKFFFPNCGDKKYLRIKRETIKTKIKVFSMKSERDLKEH